MACSNKITGNIVFSCSDLPIKGLADGEAVILNWDDITRASTDSADAVISTITAAGLGKTVTWYKELASTATALTRNAEDIDGYSHSFLARLTVSSAANAKIANELKSGRFVVVVKTQYKGTANAEKYKVYGWKTGLELSELAGNSNENSSSLLFTLTTREGTYEPYPFMTFYKTSETVTDAAYLALK